MSRRTGLVPTALLAVLTLLAAACSGSSGKAEKKATPTTTSTTTPPLSVTPTRQVVLSPIFASAGSAPSGSGPAGGSGSGAGTGTIEVAIRPSPDHKLRVVFQEHNVGDTGPQWEAAGRNAVAVATLVTGAPLGNREVGFEVSGPLDGLDASALMTVAVIALIRGDSLATDITMIGTINPDGTIGPAGGDAYTASDVLATHKARVLVPEGEPDFDQGTPKGVKVSQVADIYDAYRAFTGETLPQAPASTDTRLPAAADEKVRDKVTSWLAKYQSSVTDFQGLAPEVRQDLQSYADAAAQDLKRAQKLADEGSQAGAFQAAVSAAALMNAVAQTGQSLPMLLTQGPAPFVAHVKASQSVGGRVITLIKALAADKSRSVSDAGALISAYSNAIDALSLATFANGLFAARTSNRQVAINNAAEGSIYYNVAGSLVDAAGDALNVGQGLGGPALGPALDLADAATSFRLVAESNLSAFESVVIAPLAKAANKSIADVEQMVAGTNLDYALAQAGDNLLSSLPSYFGRGSPADYAELGGALALYDRSAGLIAEYSSLGQIDSKSLTLNGIGNAGAFNSVIGRAQIQLGATIGRLQTKGVSSITALSDDELASVDQTGSAADRFSALGDYWDGYLNSRVLAYLGGFPTP